MKNILALTLIIVPTFVVNAQINEDSSRVMLEEGINACKCSQHEYLTYYLPSPRTTLVFIAESQEGIEYIAVDTANEKFYYREYLSNDFVELPSPFFEDIVYDWSTITFTTLGKKSEQYAEFDIGVYPKSNLSGECMGDLIYQIDNTGFSYIYVSPYEKKKKK